VKYLIVNGDDFGASPGINRGIIEAHQRGILTSTSLLVNTPWSGEAAGFGRAIPELSVGLHVDLRDTLTNTTAGMGQRLSEALEEQFSRFEDLMRKRPTHLDSHHNVHRDPRILPHLLDLANRHGLFLREHSPVRYFSKFYGQWGGRTHLEQIVPESLMDMLSTEILEGVTELSCHPGYVDSNCSTAYAAERETELRTLCDSAIHAVLAAHSIRLLSYHDIDRVLIHSAG
jgi:predicted glycoside hydrolase/deacetylase ChbG (UPF0249 family)